MNKQVKTTIFGIVVIGVITFVLASVVYGLNEASKCTKAGLTPVRGMFNIICVEAK
jgi:hypothetical protein